MLSSDEQGNVWWAARTVRRRLGDIALPGIVVDGARGFNPAEEVDEFTELGGRLVLPMSIDFGADPVQPTLFARQETRLVYGVKLPGSQEADPLDGYFEQP